VFAAAIGTGRIYAVKKKLLKIMLAIHKFCIWLLFKMVLIARLYHLTCHRERRNISPYGLKIPTTQTKLF